MMPEGPEVRTLVDQLQAGVGHRLVDMVFVSGRYVRHGKPSGWEGFRSTMTPLPENEKNDDVDDPVDRIEAWRCKGKFIYLLLDKGSRSVTADPDFGRSIWITLGMTGRLVSEAAHERDPRHARWYLDLAAVDAAEVPDEGDDPSLRRRFRIYYHDTRNFGTLKFCTSKDELATKLQSLGPDLLEIKATTADIFLQLVAGSKPSVNVCRFLMDQSKMAGVGNYILAEGLYRAGIDPFCSLSELSEDQQRCLFTELQSVALDSYLAQGMTRPEGGQYRTMDGSRGSYAFELQCYGRTDTDNGERVIKLVNGPHKRTIWYTDEQLFMPRNEREAAVARIEGDSKEQSEHKEEGSTALEADPIVVRKLTNYLMDPSWTKALSPTLESDTFAQLAQFVEDEWQSQEIYPPLHQVFAALNLCPLDQVKVVIVGQDPYHGPGQGHGLAFSVQQGVRPPPSLVNIFREAQADVGIPPPPHGNLDHWAQQGVLLLNTVLTVRRGQANSHARRGWEKFTDEIIKQLNERPQGLVFLLWGSPAHKKAAAVDESRHAVIRTSHPSPLGATKTKAPFLGSKCFSRANQALEELDHTAIDWSVV